MLALPEGPCRSCTWSYAQPANRSRSSIQFVGTETTHSSAGARAGKKSHAISVPGANRQRTITTDLGGRAGLCHGGMQVPGMKMDSTCAGQWPAELVNLYLGVCVCVRVCVCVCVCVRARVCVEDAGVTSWARQTWRLRLVMDEGCRSAVVDDLVNRISGLVAVSKRV